jgi:hypothetical protein
VDVGEAKWAARQGMAIVRELDKKAGKYRRKPMPEDWVENFTSPEAAQTRQREWEERFNKLSREQLDGRHYEMRQEIRQLREDVQSYKSKTRNSVEQLVAAGYHTAEDREEYYDIMVEVSQRELEILERTYEEETTLLDKGLEAGRPSPPSEAEARNAWWAEEEARGMMIDSTGRGYDTYVYFNIGREPTRTFLASDARDFVNAPITINYNGSKKHFKTKKEYWKWLLDEGDAGFDYWAHPSGTYQEPGDTVPAWGTPPQEGDTK